MSIPNPARVGAFLEEVAGELMLPSWRRLALGEVTSKATALDPDDVVTTVDLAVEQRLSRGLREILPGSAAVGEEAVHEEPGLMDALGGDGWVWLIDPLDGTRNFVEGNDRFGIMVALLRASETRAAWIHLPARRQTFFAEEGAGAFLNGARFFARAADDAEAPVGTIYTRFMPGDVGAKIEARAAGAFRPAQGAGCSCVDYPSVARGETDFCVYYRLLPWDHAPGALIVREANGVVEHLDGTPYAPTDKNQVTIVARSRGIADRIRRALSDRGEG
ncbi:inositol monophosphatase family protein [Sorangium sp. So ce1024]|uniref:inositol monophosphatase family protein n=1 Tax=Sorangium sp. So ce1024 TaxID=3133327 RepID=UPI003F09C518